MADILDIDQARDALGWKDQQNRDRDTELTTYYLPAVTEAIENECGRMVDRRDTWRTDNPSPITTPWDGTADVRMVRINGTLATSSDWSFTDGVLTITAGWYTAGDEVTVTAADVPTPATATMVARRVLRRAYNADHQGNGTQGNRPNQPQPKIVLSEDDRLALWPYSKRAVEGFA